MESVLISSKKGILILITIIMFLVTIYSSYAAKVEYNFSVESNIWINMTAGDNAFSDCTDNPHPDNELPVSCSQEVYTNQTANADLDAEDGTNLIFKTDAENSFAVIYVDIQEDTSRISTINWSFSSNNAGGSSSVYLYIWNVSSNTWKLQGSTSTGDDWDVNVIINSTEIDDYVDSNGYSYMHYHLTSTVVVVDYFLDYVQVEVTYDPFSNPNVTTPLITPTPAYTISNLTANTTYTDGDGDDGNITFKWYVNSTNILNETFTSISNNTVLNSTLGSANFTHFNLVNVTVIATDNSSRNSATFVSSTLNISNTLPTIASATISPDPANDAASLTCLNSTIADVDGDPVTAYYTWFNDSIRVADLTEQIVGAGNTTVGEQWYCKINVSDTYNYSGAATSQTVVIGASITAPVLNSTNATTSFTNLISNPTTPTNNNSWVNLSVLFHDDNQASGEKFTAYFCKTNVFDGSTCSGGQFCKTTTNATTYPIINCKYIVENETSTTINYYVYVVDNESLYQGSGSGASGTFTLNYPPARPTISLPSNNTWTNNNFTFITITGSDPDSDNVTWYIYADNNSDPIDLVNFTTGTSFNWTNLNETNYYIKVLANDSHGYESLSNSTVTLLKVDLTSPTIQNASISNTGPYTDETVTITLDCYDALSGMNTATTDFNITTPLLTTTTEAMTLVSGVYTDVYVLLGTIGTYNLGTFRCYDQAGNLATNVSSLSFTSKTRIAGGGGGGGTLPSTSPLISTVQPQAVIQTVCGNNICEQGETPANCFVDCPVNVDRFITCLWDPEVNCLYGESWFVTLLIIIVVGIAVVIQYQAEEKRKKRRRR